MSQNFVRGLERGLLVLSLLERSSAMSLRELHAQSKLPKSTLVRILATLEASGYVRRRIGDGSWRRSGHGHYEPASMLESLLLDVGSEVLDSFCRQVVWPSDLAVYRNGAMQIVESSRRRTPFLINRSEIGLRVPVLQTGLGVAWLAYCEDSEREAIIADLAASTDPFDRPVLEPGLVESIVAETRAKGYAARAKGFQPRWRTAEDKTSGIAVPVFAGGRVIAAVNIVWVLSAYTESEFAGLYLARLQEAAREIGSRVERLQACYRGPADEERAGGLTEARAAGARTLSENLRPPAGVSSGAGRNTWNSDEPGRDASERRGGKTERSGDGRAASEREHGADHAPPGDYDDDPVLRDQIGVGLIVGDDVGKLDRQG